MSAPQPPSARTGRGVRLLRAAVFAAVCVVLAAAGHALASGATVPLWSLGAGFLAALLIAVPLAGRARSLPAIAVLLAVGQTVLHTLFGLGQQAAAAIAPPAANGPNGVRSAADAALIARASRLVCGHTAAALSPAQARRILSEARVGTGGPVHQPDALFGSGGCSGSLVPSLPMLLGHVLAAITAGWLLRRGDLALLRISELASLSAHGVAEGALVRALRAALALVLALLAGLPSAPQRGPRPPRPAELPPARPRAPMLEHTVIRRGPPAADCRLAA
ncbi:hypothetical protein ACL02U_01265 [Streptomyces sp. MS06]|uniref:hypothetical protein n=1 Tax=Streptomyces sp. MS06 TaxID=3385974 RepID=UPI0039A0B028